MKSVSFYFSVKQCLNFDFISKTSMHSSRMRTASRGGSAFMGVCLGGLHPDGVFLRGVCIHRGSVSRGSVSGGVCLRRSAFRGVCPGRPASRGVCPGGGGLHPGGSVQPPPPGLPTGRVGQTPLPSVNIMTDRQV